MGAEVYWVDDGFKAPAWGNAFETPTRKFEFTSRDMAALPLNEAVAIEGDESAYPLTLVPFDSMRLASGYIGDPPFLMKSVEDTVLKGNDVLVEINPQTAQSLGLREGMFARLTTPRGDAKVRVHLSEGLMPGLVAMPRGLGHTAYDEYLAGKGVNVNALIGSVEDPASGLDVAWGIRAKLAKA